MKKNIIVFAIVLVILSCIGCSSLSNSSTSKYLLCNATSGGGGMSEVENGFFYLFDQRLYYADKTDMSTWVPVCNKPDCQHELSSDCNAYIEYELTQKGEDLYYFTQNMNKILIYQVSKDGSEGKVVHELSLEEGEIFVSRGVISQSYFLFAYVCLDENGNYTRNLIRLDKDGTVHKLFSEITDSEATLGITWPASYQAVQGEEAIIADFLVKDGTFGQNVLWKVDGDTPERVNLPEDVSILYSYLTDETFTYYKSGEGFYQIDLESGEETLIMENQLEDGRGYILTDEYMVECNRYNGYTPEEAFLKVYNGEKWLDVPLPDEIAKLDCHFNPTAIASDRIFFVQSKIGDMVSSNHQMYYMMLNDDTPELIHCHTFGEDIYFEIPEETVKETDDFEDVVVFDTEEYLMKVTDTSIEKVWGEDAYKVTMYCENKTDNKDFYFVLQDGAVNGIECGLAAGINLYAEESKEHVFYIGQSQAQNAGIADAYTVEEYTDISFFIVAEDEDISYQYDPNIGRYDPKTGEKPQQKVVHIYPQGEENARTYVRKSKDTDKVLIDNEYVTVTLVGFETAIATNDVAKLFIQNKTDKNIQFVCQEFVSVNNTVLNKTWESGTFILPKCCAYESIKLSETILKEQNITDVEKLEVLLRMSYADINFGRSIGDDFVNETFILNP